MSFHQPFKDPRGFKDNSPTPEYFYKQLDDEFHFDFDPCKLNSPGLREFDGLGSSWGKRTFVNPPFSAKKPWIRKAIEESKKGNLVVMLLPVDTSTSWFHDLILPYAEIRWVRGRLREPGHAPYKWATMLAIFRPKEAVCMVDGNHEQ